MSGNSIFRRGALTSGVVNLKRLKHNVIGRDLVILTSWTGRPLLMPGGEYLFRMIISFVLGYIIHHIGFLVREVPITFVGFLTLGALTKIVKTGIIYKLWNELFTYFVSGLVRQDTS